MEKCCPVPQKLFFSLLMAMRDILFQLGMLEKIISIISKSGILNGF